MGEISKLPELWCYVVIFSARTSASLEGYAETAERMEVLAQQQPGFPGDIIRGMGRRKRDTISYWRDEESIMNWKRNPEHCEAQRMGREKWY